MSDERTTPAKREKLQTQAVEALGRGFLVSRLIREKIGVSLPLWDDGIDLIAHIRDEKQQKFVARPLQLKVSTNTYVGLYEKYKDTPELRMVFIWLNADTEKSRIFVMTYDSLYSMFSDHGHLETRSWIDQRGFSTSKASPQKLECMQPFEVGQKTLKELIFSKASSA